MAIRPMQRPHLKRRALSTIKRAMGTLAAVLVLAGLLVLTLAGCFVLGPWPFALLAACFYAASRLLRQRPAGQEPGLPAPG